MTLQANGPALDIVGAPHPMIGASADTPAVDSADIAVSPPARTTTSAAAANPFRVALLVHSTLPRGGVVHALELGDALAALGHQVDLLAPSTDGAGLFRSPRSSACRFVPVPAGPAPAGDLVALVVQRLNDWACYFDSAHVEAYDIFHAQDSISANALADLASAGRISGYLRTIHHLDAFIDPQLDAWQTRGFTAAERLLCVSEHWRETMRTRYARQADVVSNGVDLHRFSSRPDANDAILASRLKLGPGPRFLSVGGIEQRKNSLDALEAFRRFRRDHPHAQWIIAGGASLLNHDAYARRFHAALADAGLRIGTDIVLAGRVDDAMMPALFRLADALLFPSLTEGFGLVVLEALASATPVVVSRIAPFTEYLPDDAVEWAVPDDPASIAQAMARAVDPSPRQAPRRHARRIAGLAVCARFAWSRSAIAHVAVYRDVLSQRAAAAGALASRQKEESLHA